VSSAAESTWVVKVATTDDYATLSDFYAACSVIMVECDKKPVAGPDVENSSKKNLGRIKYIVVHDPNANTSGASSSGSSNISSNSTSSSSSSASNRLAVNSNFAAGTVIDTPRSGTLCAGVPICN
jgi:hypothetical protein